MRGFRCVLLALLATSTIGHAASAAESPRFGRGAPDDRPRARAGRSLDAAVWYPAGAGGPLASVGESAVFEGTPARQDAPVADGSLSPHPPLARRLAFRPDDSGAWIASRPAAGGFVVAAPVPPRLEGAQAWDSLKEPWLRPAGPRATPTAVEKDAILQLRRDAEATGVLGFQLGGTSALALVGARLDGQRYARSCDGGGRAVDRAWSARNGIDLHGIDVPLAERSSIDRRARVAVAVDPEPSGELDPASLAGISAPVRVIDLGEPGAARPGSEAAAGLVRAIPGAKHGVAADAGRFGAFSPCKPKGRAILREDGEDEAPCRDGQRPRAEVHALLTEMVATFFS